MSMLFAEVRLLLSLVYLTFIVKCQNDECLQTNNAHNLPTFMGYRGPVGERIPHQHQAIVTTYKLNCCGNITEWGVDLNPVQDNHHFNFDFQVWRPSSTVNKTGCYSLVDNYAAMSISIETMVTESHVARVTPLYQLQFQPGDVLRFYVESDTEISPEDDGVVLLDSGAFNSEKVWYASITSRTSQSGSCPYPIETGGVLSLSTHAAPVISISTSVYSCARSPSLSISTSSAVKVMTTNSGRLSTVMTLLEVPTDAVEHNVPLISGAVVAAFVVLCILLMTMIVIAITVARKRQVVERVSQLEVTNEMMATDVELVKTKRDVTDTEVTLHKQAGTRKSIETKANPSYGEVGEKMNLKANPCYEQAGIRISKSIETKDNPYEEVDEEVYY